MVVPSRARDVLSSVGWLSRQPDAFREELFHRAVRVRFAAGEIVYRVGDPLGGIYGVVSGAVLVSMAPDAGSPQMMHVLASGGWTGEGSFLSRQPRRIELRAALASEAVYLPLEAMDQMAARKPQVIRNFLQILMLNLDLLLLTIRDLQEPDEHRRIARALRRITTYENVPIPLPQAALGILANASRKTVNAALGRFEKSGWVKRGYRSITITDRIRLTAFADAVAE